MVTEKVAVDIYSGELDQQIGKSLTDKLCGNLEPTEGVYLESNFEPCLTGGCASVLFGSTLNNFGVQELLNYFAEITPSPHPAQAGEREVKPDEPRSTEFTFRMIANIDSNHRLRVTFCKVCLGEFVRNVPYTHVRHEKITRFSLPIQLMAQCETTIDETYVGDVIGLSDNGTFKIGDTPTGGEMFHFRGLPSFPPGMFKHIENADPMKQEQLARGIDQLMNEGVAQLFVNRFNNRKTIGTAGQLRSKVTQCHLLNEYNASCCWEPISLYKTYWVGSDDSAELEVLKKRKYQYMAKNREGYDVFLADSDHVLQMAQMDFKHIKFHFIGEFQSMFR